MSPELHHILEISENTKNSEFMNWMLKLGTVESPNTPLRSNENKNRYDLSAISGSCKIDQT